eukprot:COSAG01_NODE_5978_length_3920_cov_210.481026_6_plen_38_part_00
MKLNIVIGTVSSAAYECGCAVTVGARVRATSHDMACG